MDPTAQGLERFVGQVIGGYRLMQVLGTGATGAVFLGERVETGSDGSLPQQAALKILMPPMQASTEERAEFRRRFEREAQAVQLLHSPHIVPVLAAGEDAATGLPYMVMPYLAGGTLAVRLGQGPLAFSLAADYIAQLAAALDYAHATGIAHRDLKPANILLDDQGHLLLTDFGIARLFESAATHMTTTGRVLGTLEYMSPEQAQGEHAGPLADVYSLGIIAYQMVTGRVPFQGSTLARLVVAHLQEPPPAPRQLRPDLPPVAETALLRALSKRPEDRFTSAGLFARAFAEGLRERRVDWGARAAPSVSAHASPPNTPWAPTGAASAAPTTQSGYVPAPTAIAAAPRAQASRRGPWGVLMLAVTVLVLVGIGIALITTGVGAKLFPQVAGVGRPPSASPTSTPVPEHWVQVASPTHDLLFGVSMTSSSQGWAVGGGGISNSQTWSAVILQYANGSWKVHDTIGGILLYSVGMVSATDGWASGANNDGQAAFYHWDGQNWRKAPSPPIGEANSVSVTSNGDGWAVGDQPSSGKYFIDVQFFHLSGGSWTAIPKPAGIPAAIYEMASVQTMPDGEAWATGVNGNDGTSVIMHYQGGHWNTQVFPQGTYVDGVCMASDTEGWAGTVSGVLHYENGQWSPQTTPGGIGIYQCHMLSTDEGWAVGATGNNVTHTSYILHYQHGTWTQTSPPSPPDVLLQGIDMDSATDGWVVGDSGTIIHYVPVTS